METIGERFTYLIDKKGISVYKVSLKTGIAQSTLSRIKNHNATPNYANREVLAGYFGVDVDWLIDGESKKEIALNNIIGNEFEIIKDKGYNYINMPSGQMVALIPFIKDDFTDNFALNPNDKSILPLYPLLVSNRLMCDFIALRIKDDSMQDGDNYNIKSGNVVIAKEINKKIWGTEGLYSGMNTFVIISNGLIFVRFVNIIDKNTLMLFASNKAYSSFKISLNNIDKIFKIEMLVKNL